MSRIWIDVEDIFLHAASFRRPSGIQRVVFELCQALTFTQGIGLLRHAGRDGFCVASWHDLAALFRAMARSAPPPSTPNGFWPSQRAALQALAALPGTLLPPRATGPDPDFQPGDVLLVAGAGWDDPTHTRRLHATKTRFGLRLAVLVYDLIPLRRPEWFDTQMRTRFTTWIDALLRHADHLLAISQATAADIARRRIERGLQKLPAQVIRLGDGFTPAPGASTGLSGRYALFVSTLELRKNHALLVEVWRILLHRHGPDAVPRLVFVGREGPLVGDWLAMLRASRFLDGHVIWRQDTSDADLTALYAGCDFTLFPSLYEGWGLPVAESLCFGTPCLASGATSIPEVGGDLVRYFDPMDLDDTLRAIGDVVASPESLPTWRARISAGFHPTPWSATAAMLLDALRNGSKLQL